MATKPTQCDKIVEKLTKEFESMDGYSAEKFAEQLIEKQIPPNHILEAAIAAKAEFAVEICLQFAEPSKDQEKAIIDGGLVTTSKMAWISHFKTRRADPTKWDPK